MYNTCIWFCLPKCVSFDSWNLKTNKNTCGLNVKKTLNYFFPGECTHLGIVFGKLNRLNTDIIVFRI